MSTRRPTDTGPHTGHSRASTVSGFSGVPGDVSVSGDATVAGHSVPNQPDAKSPRLTEKHLARLPAAVAVPGYDRAGTAAGIVHLGVGAFHRAHQAWYTEQALNRFGGDWAIVGASLRSPAVRDRLAPQDGLYTVVERDGEHSEYRVVGAIKSLLVAAEDPRLLVAQLADPAIRVITLTITEKGYCYDAGLGRLRLDHPEIRRDLERFFETRLETQPETPLSAIGFLVASLARRRQQGCGGVTLLSCDNMPDNGRVLETVITDFVTEADPSLLSWIRDHVTFPSSMVDRIVPATAAEDLAELELTLGYRDEAAVFTEPFSQWVVEDKFARGAPRWGEVGVLLTDDVTPFETMKLRLLNGSHSLMAYLGFLAGHDHVHRAMADAGLARLVRHYMDQQAGPTLNVPAGFDIEGFKRGLCRRFANAALNHRTYQIAQDGSQKIPQRWLATVRELARLGLPTRLLALAVAGWIRYLGGRRDSGQVFVVDDPLLAELREAAEQGGEAGREIAAVLGFRPVFGDLVTVCPGFVDEVADFYRQLSTVGVQATVEHFWSGR